jgi:hypothetical protein
MAGPLGTLIPTGTGGPILSGYGSLAVTGTSALVDTLTVGSGSSGFPTTQTSVTLFNSSAGLLYLCPFGGTASSTVGIPIAGGTSLQITLLNPSLMTIVAASTATLWCWW